MKSPVLRHLLRSSLPIILVVAGTVASLPIWAQDLAGDERRFVQIFMEDAAIVENIWIEGQFRFQDLDGADDSIAFGPIFAISPIDNLEVGGHFAFTDIDFGKTSESGITDTTVYAKWQFFRNPVQFSVGAEVNLPTGDEDDLLGTGEFDIAVFGAVRKNLDDVILTGHIGLRSNRDADVGASVLPGGEVNRDGKTSIFLGGGAMFPVKKRWAVGGELTVETERYEETDSAVEILASGYWFAQENLTLRAGFGVGLADDSPDFEVVFGLVGHF